MESNTRPARNRDVDVVGNDGQPVWDDARVAIRREGWRPIQRWRRRDAATSDIRTKKLVVHAKVRSVHLNGGLRSNLLSKRVVHLKGNNQVRNKVGCGVPRRSCRSAQLKK